MWLLTAVLLMQTASPGVSQDISASSPLEEIRYAVTERDRTIVWVAYANGRTTHSEYDRREKKVAGTELFASAEAFQRMSATLRSVETTGRLTCSAPQRRAPEASISWTRGVQTVELKLIRGCGTREIGEAFRDIIGTSRVTSRLVGDDEWEEFTPQSPTSISAPVPRTPDTGTTSFASGPEAPDAIVYRAIGARGVLGGGWRIDRQGRGALTFYRDGGDAVVTRAFTFEVGGFERIRSLLSGMEDLQAACSDITELHAPIGFWSWVRGSQTTTVRLEGHCIPQDGEEADELVRSWMGSEIRQDRR